MQSFNLTLPDVHVENASCNLVVTHVNDGLVFEFRNHAGQLVASGVVELCEGKLRLLAWNEEDEGNDPTLDMNLVDNVKDAHARRFCPHWGHAIELLEGRWFDTKGNFKCAGREFPEEGHQANEE